MPIKVISTILEENSKTEMNEVTTEMIESKLDKLDEINPKTLDEAIEIEAIITLGSTTIDYMCEGMGPKGYAEFIKRYNNFTNTKN